MSKVILKKTEPRAYDEITRYEVWRDDLLVGTVQSLRRPREYCLSDTLVTRIEVRGFDTEWQAHLAGHFHPVISRAATRGAAMKALMEACPA